MIVAPITPEEADVPIAVRICPTKMSRDDYAKVMADLERTRGGTPEGRLFHAGYGALYEKGSGSVEAAPGVFNPGDSSNRYLMINRGLFLKASYLRRF